MLIFVDDSFFFIFIYKKGISGKAWIFWNYVGNVILLLLLLFLIVEILP